MKAWPGAGQVHSGHLLADVIASGVVCSHTEKMHTVVSLSALPAALSPFGAPRKLQGQADQPEQKQAVHPRFSKASTHFIPPELTGLG